MTLNYCPYCMKDTEFEDGFCLTCGSKFSKKDLLSLIEQQQIVIDSLENQVHLAEYTIGTFEYPQYFTDYIQ